MALWNTGFHNIVDRDGQSLVIDSQAIDAFLLLSEVNQHSDQKFGLVIRAAESFFVRARRLISSLQKEVLFFDTPTSLKTSMLGWRAT